MLRTNNCFALVSYIKHRLSSDKRFSEISVGRSKRNNNLLLNYTSIENVIILGVHC